MVLIAVVPVLPGITGHCDHYGTLRDIRSGLQRYLPRCQQWSERFATGTLCASSAFFLPSPSMIRRVAIIMTVLLAASPARPETPPEQAQAIEELRGIPSNLQLNRDGSVRFVRFSHSNVTDEHVAKTAAFAQLDYLAVVTPNVTDKGLEHIGQLTNLDSLFLSDSAVTDATLVRLEPLQKLERLYLDRTQISDTGLKPIGSLKLLTTLSLSGTGISDEGVAALASLQNLDTLNLSDTQVTDACLQHLSGLGKLRVLTLDGTAITDEQTHLLKDFPAIESLSLQRTRITTAGLESLSEVSTLTHLDLRGTSIDAADVTKVTDATPKLTVSLDPSEVAAQNSLQRYLAGDKLRSATPAPVFAFPAHDTQPLLPGADGRFLSTAEIPDFQRHVVPLFGRLGCNGRTCHGSFQGKGGFSLSMFGYDFDADLKALTGGEHPRVDVANVEQSLILKKPTSDDEHGGGLRFEAGGWEYHLLKRWIAGGAEGVNKPLKIQHFEVTPQEVVFTAAGESVQLTCVAVWDDGTREDVTPLTRFRTNDDTVAEVSGGGRIVSKSPGDTYVVSFYDNAVYSTLVMMPVSEEIGDRFPQVSTSTEVDRLVVRKLSQMGIEPSVLCSDEEFLRRLSLDMTGTLPSPQELMAFLQNTSIQKRQNKIDELLSTEAYATWWAVKLADLTGSNSQSLGSTDMNSPASEQWNAWLQRRLRDNVGWDRIAAGIILAASRRPGQTYESYAAEQSLHLKSKGGTDYTDLENPMHYYWFRSNNQTDTDRALTFGYTFMGIRLQCAQCHKHPFDQWSKDDFEKFAGFFKRIRTGVAPDAAESQMFLKIQLGVPVKLDTAALRRQMYLRVSAEGLPIPWNEVFIDPPTEKPWPARILGGDEFDLNEFDDPREPLFEWLVRKDNPYFAPAFVNRVWAHYFGVGIVDPPDNFNIANPPGNKPLLNWLSEQFIARGYDIQWLHRTIASSDTYQRSMITTATNRTDERNFSHSLVRRLPAEVTIDAILRATARDDVAAQYFDNMVGRKIAQHPKSYQARGIDYSLLVFGKPRRTTSCDCERQDQPTLLQSLYVRNDAEMIGWLERSDGWLMSVAKELSQSLSSDVKGGEQPSAVKPQFADEAKTAELIRTAYRRTLNRDPDETELHSSQDHISKSVNTVEGLRDIMWALLNTQEFLTNH